MIYDSFGGMTPLSTVDIRLEKKHDVEEPRKVEDTDESNRSQLDMDKQNIAKKPSIQEMPQDIDPELEAYNRKGDSIGKASPEQIAADHHQGSVNIFV